MDNYMSVSEWREYGRKYGYWDYFKQPFITALVDNIDKTGPILLETICDKCKDFAGGNYTFTCDQCKTAYKANKYRKGDKKLFIYEINDTNSNN